MSDYASAVRLMADKGMSAHDIADILEAMAAAPTSGADRQRRYRERKAAEHSACDVTCDVTPLRNDAPPLPKPPQTPQTPTPPDINPPHTRARAGIFPCPEGVDPQHWQDLLANRKTKRLTNTPTAYRQQLKALAEFADDEWPPGRIVEFAAARGWGAIHDPRTSFNGQPNSQQRRAEHGTDSLTAIALQRLGSSPPP